MGTLAVRSVHGGNSKPVWRAVGQPGHLGCGAGGRDRRTHAGDIGKGRFTGIDPILLHVGRGLDTGPGQLHVSAEGLGRQATGVGQPGNAGDGRTAALIGCGHVVPGGDFKRVGRGGRQAGQLKRAQIGCQGCEFAAAVHVDPVAGQVAGAVGRSGPRDQQAIFKGLHRQAGDVLRGLDVFQGRRNCGNGGIGVSHHILGHHGEPDGGSFGQAGGSK